MTNLSKAAIIAAVISAPTLAQAEDWTGFYIGAQVGWSDLSVLSASDDDVSYGIHAGYNHDLGNFVLGGEIDYSTSEYSFGGGTLDVDTLRVKARAGYDIGPALFYGVLGYVDLDTDLVSEDGYSYGIGASYKVTDNVVVGAEYLRDEVDILGVDFEVDSFNIRASYQF
ncbi:outer membrane protein [Pseudohalocynthiibacter aestuariivivens]|uniref:Outer membrane protein n=1 Tax=Pseudohalocynthiibacter aestuariivivens TaxID=1591409 RepID=A0ABV5JHU9_9RHOB|nr:MULTISPECIES: porin family protein [Pseudohalocynthiibacter]MBS9716244.1 porin family protein [Pseudohalocynthiibacter aestuariivivens]MCK0100949.1 porin family protein [Pseudohalocynthiibacter sp. F2068]